MAARKRSKLARAKSAPRGSSARYPKASQPRWAISGAPYARQAAAPIPLLSAAGARTKRIEVGTGVIDMR